MKNKKKYAAIDIGSNGIRLLIASVSEKNRLIHVHKLSLVRVPIRLGEDVFETGEIGKEKQKRFLKAIKAYKLLMEVYGVSQYRACATSAMREAKNGTEICKNIKKETGISIELINGKEESDLLFSTLFTQKIDKKGNYLFIDVGGGSTEVTIFEEGKRIKSKSFKIGTVRLLQNKVKEKVWEEMDNWLEFINQGNKKYIGIGTGGNINRYFKMSNNEYLEPLKSNILNNYYQELKQLNPEERAEKYRLRKDRADVIVPAGKIYLSILQKCEIEEIIVPKIGLSDGMVYTLYLNNRK